MPPRELSSSNRPQYVSDTIHYATAAMQGLLANPQTKSRANADVQRVAQIAWQVAEEMMKCELEASQHHRRRVGRASEMESSLDDTYWSQNRERQETICPNRKEKPF